MLTNLALLLAQRDTFPDFPASTTAPQPSAGDWASVIGMMCCCYGSIFLIFGLPWAAGLWKSFVKAGEPGWAAIIPIYNVVVWMKLIGQPASRTIFHLIPLVNIYFFFVDGLAFLRCFGKDVGFLIGIWLLPYVFWPILGFGSAQYTPRAGAGMGGGGFSPPPGPRPGGPRPGGPPPQGPRPGGPQGGIRPGGPGGAPPRR
ncbi:MAG: hypothetical protein JNM56_28720 [Planctomycetia bacterium]|nr:hypothetical protein [Planctomycetia bacterium]